MIECMGLSGPYIKIEGWINHTIYGPIRAAHTLWMNDGSIIPYMEKVRGSRGIPFGGGDIFDRGDRVLNCPPTTFEIRLFFYRTLIFI